MASVTRSRGKVKLSTRLTRRNEVTRHVDDEVPTTGMYSQQRNATEAPMTQTQCVRVSEFTGLERIKAMDMYLE